MIPRHLCVDCKMTWSPAALTSEQSQRLSIYASYLQKWNDRINLVAKSTLSDAMERHFYDSAQLIPLLPAEITPITDIGSGGGFPGLVLAALTSHPVTLIESDGRKCEFLREVSRAIGVHVTIIQSRIEKAELLPVPLITARALATVSDILEITAHLRTPQTRYLLLKGENAENELTAAKKVWHIDDRKVSSVTSTTGSVIDIKGVYRYAGSSKNGHK